MNSKRPSRSAALTFCAVAISFLFTFANISCQGQRVASLSGFQLAFGTEIANSDMWGNQRREKVPAEPLALCALVAAVAGAILVLAGPLVRRLTTLLGGLGALLLMILINKMARDATLRSSGMLEVTPGSGLIAAIGLFLLASCLAWVIGKERGVSTLTAPDKLPDVTQGI
jgi:hypothetical protein